MKVHRSVRMPSPLLNNFTKRMTRNRRKNVMEILALSSVFWEKHQTAFKTQFMLMRYNVFPLSTSVRLCHTSHSVCGLCDECVNRPCVWVFYRSASFTAHFHAEFVHALQASHSQQQMLNGPIFITKTFFSRHLTPVYTANTAASVCFNKSKSSY